MKRKHWKDLTSSRADVANYIHAFYNTERRHSTLDDVSHAAFEAAFAARQSALEQAA